MFYLSRLTFEESKLILDLCLQGTFTHSCLTSQPIPSLMQSDDVMDRNSFWGQWENLNCQLLASSLLFSRGDPSSMQLRFSISDPLTWSYCGRRAVMDFKEYKYVFIFWIKIYWIKISNNQSQSIFVSSTVLEAESIHVDSWTCIVANIMQAICHASNG